MSGADTVKVDMTRPGMDPLDTLLPSCEITLEFKNVSFTIPDPENPGQTRVLLKNISGIVRSGEVLAILGASGSGKTLLLDILAGTIAPSQRLTGSILFNGCTRQDAKSRLKRVSAYVHATDDLMATLSVYETLMYAADLQLPASVRSEEKKRLVNNIIDDLGLRICASTLVGGQFIRGISGGQRKRLAIGIEMISRPCLAFLDVPTSGLDSTAANVVMDGIIKLARQNRTVVTTIHQPSSTLFAKFDKIMLLSHGEVVYFGPAKTAIDFFGSLGYRCPPLANPADFFMQKINTDFKGTTTENVQELIEGYEESDGKKKLMAQLEAGASLQSECRAPENGVVAVGENMKHPVEPYARSSIRQFGILLQRNFQNAIRNPALYWVRVAMFVMMGIVLGTLYANMNNSETDVFNRLALLFFLVAFLSFMTVASLPELIVDRAIFTRERRNGSYRVSSYLMASTFASLPWILLITLLVSIIVYWWVGFVDGRFGYFFALLFGALFCAESIVVLIASSTRIFLLGLAAASGMFGLFMLVSGFFLNFTDIPPYFKWISYLSFHMYAFRSMAYNELHGESFRCDYSGALANVCTVQSPRTFSGDTVLDFYGFDTDTRGLDVGVLFAMIVAYRILAYVVLRLQTGRRS
eukprot:ANDGO_05083.mRNA.1 ABC transporter G family member 15